MESEKFTNLGKNLNSKTKIIPIESDSNLGIIQKPP